MSSDESYWLDKTDDELFAKINGPTLDELIKINLALGLPVDFFSSIPENPNSFYGLDDDDDE